MQIEFIAEIKKVTSKALVSLDKEYEVVMRSPDIKLMELSKLPADELVKVRIEEDAS